MKELIKLENIDKNYYMINTTQRVLKNINFSINEGEFVSIMGPSGSGKSTCMNILGCLDTPSAGNYFLEEHNVANYNSVELANIRNKYLSFVFQNFNLLSQRTILDNVALPLIYAGISQKEREKLAREKINRVKLDKYEKYFPAQLSGGMKQRVAIARALVTSPKIIFADEPTGNLDSTTSYEIMNIFKELNQEGKITIIMVTHENDIALYSDRIIKITDGIVVYDGKSGKEVS